MPITDWPQQERPREKLLAQGPERLSDAELLAIFIRIGIPGKTAVDLGRQLLQEFGGLRQIIEADQAQLCRAQGLGTAKYVQFKAALEISRRYLFQSLQRTNALANPQDVYRYLTACLRAYKQEVFACLFLDNTHRAISFDELFYGTIHSATIHPREVVKMALHHNAAAVIFAHNHPSGIAEPSQADEAITHKLKHALALIDVRVLDHIIVGDGQMTSLAERGIL
jgi:DNA repair protein RadC